MHPPEFCEVGWGRRVFIPGFHSTVVMDIPFGRCRAIELSATFDDIICLFKVYMQFKTVNDMI
jgi:hypothetical protein